MTDELILSKLSSLEVTQKQDVIDYIGKLSNGKKPQKIHPKRGCMKGTFKLEKDFDSPLEDFSDYS